MVQHRRCPSLPSHPTDSVTVNNLSSLDEDVSKNLMALKNYSGDVEADFGLTFSIMEDGMMRLSQG